MKKISTLAYLIFSLGFFLKFFHVHYNAILMLIAILLMLVSNCISAFKKDSEKVNILQSFTTTAWFILLFFTIKFLLYSKIVFTIALVLTLITVILAQRQKTKTGFLLLSICMSISLLFYIIPSDKKYYLLDIKWNYEIDSDYYSWDKYSWHLYQNKKYKEALLASDQALKIAESINDEEWITLIKEHTIKIKEKRWDHFR